jgi:hypothetical protein
MVRYFGEKPRSRACENCHLSLLIAVLLNAVSYGYLPINLSEMIIISRSLEAPLSYRLFLIGYAYYPLVGKPLLKNRRRTLSRTTGKLQSSR